MQYINETNKQTKRNKQIKESDLGSVTTAIHIPTGDIFLNNSLRVRLLWVLSTRTPTTGTVEEEELYSSEMISEME